MIVVSNTSPLNFLVLIGTAAVLPALFDRVVAPPAVIEELQAAGAPDAVKAWIRDGSGDKADAHPCTGTVLPNIMLDSTGQRGTAFLPGLWPRGDCRSVLASIGAQVPV